MLRSPPSLSVRYRRALLCAALLCARAGAAELGDWTVASYIGEPLDAEVELVALTPDDLAGLQVGLASQDVYRAANVAIPPALAGLRLTIVQQGARRFLHILSAYPVDASHLNLFFQLSANGHSVVRAATLWLARNPNPAPPAAASPPVALAPAPVPPVAALASAAPAAVARSAAPHRAGPSAGPDGAIAAAPVPPAAALAPPSSAPPSSGASGAQGPRSARPSRAAAPPAAAPACAVQASARAAAGAALEGNNAALNEKLVELEGKVKVLQMELAPQFALPAQAASAPAAPRRPAVPAVRPRASGGARPAVLIGAALGGLALLAGAAFAFLRYRRGRGAGPASAWARLRRPFQRSVKAPVPVEPPSEAVAEPLIE